MNKKILLLSFKYFKCIIFSKSFIVLLSFTFFFASINVGFAQKKKWKQFHASKSVTMYFSPKSLKGTAIKQVAVLLNFSTSQTTSDGKKVRSIRMIQNYDCTTSRFRLRSGINYSEEMLKGNEVSSGREITPWRIVPNGTPYSKLMKKICD